ncbi:hypothetical protein [Nonomuraea sp. B1E8]|uniref:hypothetical protein n=1 Tax=unclassified Nonomuraea TaxID=2593643 RepID=UPI00325C6FA0
MYATAANTGCSAAIRQPSTTASITESAARPACHRMKSREVTGRRQRSMRTCSTESNST